MITLMHLSPYIGDAMLPSPNHGARRATAIVGVVLHATADRGNESRVLSRLRSPGSGASYHLVVGRDGNVTRLVGDQQRAWHAGAARWRGRRDVDAVTIGVGIANRNDGEPFTDAQYRRVADIVAHYVTQGLTIRDVVGHGEMTTHRAGDPFAWDWSRFRELVNRRLDTGNSRRCEPSTRATVVPETQPERVGSEAKSVLRSRTLWLNLLALLAASSVLTAQGLDLAHSIGIPLSEEFTRWSLFGIGLLNIILRVRTTRPVSCRRPLARA